MSKRMIYRLFGSGGVCNILAYVEVLAFLSSHLMFLYTLGVASPSSTRFAAASAQRKTMSSRFFSISSFHYRVELARQLEIRQLEIKVLLQTYVCVLIALSKINVD